MLRGELIKQVNRQAARFRAKQKIITGLIGGVGVQAAAAGCQRKESCRVFVGKKSLPVGVFFNAGPFMIIETSAAQAAIIKFKTKGLD